MKLLTGLITIVSLFCALSTSAQQPSWNEAQSEVWALMKQSWADDVAENGKWPADYIHDNYVGWGDGEAAPRYKDSVIAWTRFGDESNTILMYEVSPEAIVVEGDTAVIHYNLTTVSEDIKGKRTSRVGRATEVLVRDGQTWKWLAIAGYDPKLND
jgi:hypothetical protein